MKNILILLLILLCGCATTNYVDYVPPSDIEEEIMSTTIDRDFDTVWTSIIDHISSTFFSIDNFERASGLITVEFGASNPEEFVNCGQFTASWTENYQSYDFNGTYTEFISIYRRGSLSGRMNITAREISDNQTQVRVNARYILTADSGTWSFDSGSSASINVSQTSNSIRTCNPTYKAESSILDAVRALAE